MLRALPGGRSRQIEAASADRLPACKRSNAGAVALDLDDPQRQPFAAEPRWLKVGGHQASSASAATLMTALYLEIMRPQDRIAVKPHAAPIFHALQYLLGRQSREKLERFRALGGAQAYPSRTKDGDIVDSLPGSVGLGVGMTLFASLVQDYLRLHRLLPADNPAGAD